MTHYSVACAPDLAGPVQHEVCHLAACECECHEPGKSGVLLTGRPTFNQAGFYRLKEPMKVEVQWEPGGKEFFFDLLASIPLRCGNCAERFVPKDDEAPCPNCGEDPIWDPPTCGACTPLEEAGVILPDCPVCDSLCQDYESNKLSDEVCGNQDSSAPPPGGRR